MLTLLFTGCLLDKQGYLDRRAELVDLDGDNVQALDDCDDDDDTVFPGATETCDGVDEDCDGIVDNDASDATPWYRDADGDGHGSDAGSEAVVSCTAPTSAYSDLGDDCDDGDGDSFPGAHEVAYDDVDQDCDGVDLTDVDGDGYASSNAGGTDCDDQEEAVHPGATETPYDGIDQDCSGADSDDLDGDGSVGTQASGDDCDDTDASIAPGAGETWANGYTDNDCDGELEPATLYYGADAWLGEREGAEVGRRLSSLGDVTGDGLAEYLVAGPYDSDLYENGGIVYLVSGSEGGSLSSSHTLVAGGAWWFMSDVDGGPDVDGDGLPDLAVSAAGYDNSRGRTWIVSGATLAAGTNLNPGDVALASVTGDAEVGYCGAAVSFLGDLMGDGQDWLAVGESYATVGENAEAGRIAAFAGLGGDVSIDDGDIQAAGYYGAGHFGALLAPAGDIDGDGLDDYLVGFDSGDVAVILPGGVESPVVPDDAIFRLTRSNEDRVDAQMVGDVDGDGRNDLLALHDTSAAKFFTYLSANPVQVVEDATSVVDYGADSFGYASVDLGDLDGDGLGETFLPVQWSVGAETSLGGIWPGSFVTLGSSRPVEDASLQAVSLRQGSAFGYRAELSDDVDGDGAKDIILGGYGDPEAADLAGAVITITVPR